MSVQAASAHYLVTKVHANFLDSPVPHEINCHISPPPSSFRAAEMDAPADSMELEEGQTA